MNLLDLLPLELDVKTELDPIVDEFSRAIPGFRKKLDWSSVTSYGLAILVVWSVREIVAIRWRIRNLSQR